MPRQPVVFSSTAGRQGLGLAEQAAGRQGLSFENRSSHCIDA